MTDPNHEVRLLELLADEKQPVLSPYFEAKMRRALAEEDVASIHRARVRRLVRQGALAMLLFSALVLWRYPYLHWLVPLMISQCLPEDWLDAAANRFSKQEG